jgi:hypothetical protein
MHIWMMSSILALQLAAGQPVHRVFKCMEAGITSYQSAPCTGRQVSSWEVASERADPDIERRLEQLRTELRSRKNAGQPALRGGSRSGLRSGRGVASPNPCERARSGREAAFKKAGHRRSFQLSSRWDNAVHDACR